MSRITSSGTVTSSKVPAWCPFSCYRFAVGSLTASLAVDANACVSDDEETVAVPPPMPVGIPDSAVLDGQTLTFGLVSNDCSDEEPGSP